LHVAHRPRLTTTHGTSRAKCRRATRRVRPRALPPKPPPRPAAIACRANLAPVASAYLHPAGPGPPRGLEPPRPASTPPARFLSAGAPLRPLDEVAPHPHSNQLRGRCAYTSPIHHAAVRHAMRLACGLPACLIRPRNPSPRCRPRPNWLDPGEIQPFQVPAGPRVTAHPTSLGPHRVVHAGPRTPGRRLARRSARPNEPASSVIARRTSFNPRENPFRWHPAAAVL